MPALGGHVGLGSSKEAASGPLHNAGSRHVHRADGRSGTMTALAVKMWYVTLFLVSGVRRLSKGTAASLV